MDAANILFVLVKNTVCGQPVDGDVLKNSAILPELFFLAKKHSLVQIVAYAIIQNGLLPADSPEYAAFYKKHLSAITRVTQIQHEEREITQVLEQAKIRHVMLKGAVMRTLYPEGWMRTSSDIDTLVPEEDLERAVTVLTEQLGYRIHGKKNYHDICLVSPSGVPLELHFSILENMDDLDAVLQDVWQYVVPIEGQEYACLETPEFFLFHHLAHMTYHFMGGGCGIRFFLDLWIIKNKLNVDLDSVRHLTDAAGITVFAQAAFHITDHWFANTPITETEQRMETYILDGGCFGSKRAHVAIRQNAHGSKGWYILRRIFPTRKVLEILYPWTKNHPWLLPAAYVLRWFTLLSPHKRMRIKEELATGSTITKAERASVAALFSELGLK